MGIVKQDGGMILHTNGAAHFTDHPEFGHIPGGLHYVDLTQWEGESRDFTEDDIKKIN
ncbi:MULTISPECIES: hypothetical protein [unclassified Burkholderia]|uniref:hypothetical protein n=1 Tax=unclassified Burkholderia TaxID=2613784 RepID=UPI000B0F0C67|nr:MULTISPECIES: hypothetical protein [unclassified Burkholderia]